MNIKKLKQTFSLEELMKLSFLGLGSIMNVIAASILFFDNSLYLWIFLFIFGIEAFIVILSYVILKD